MKVIRGVEQLTERYPAPVVTLGNFDGVHRGHQKIISEVIKRAREINGTPMAITFDPHPVRVLYPEKGVRILTPPDEKARLMAHYGIEKLLFINFDRDFARIEPDSFITDVLVERIGVRTIIVGHGYAFGRGKKGTTDLMRRRGKKYGFDLSVIRNTQNEGEPVSSSRIRNLIARGRVAEASELLGRPYMVAGTVIKGAGRGAKLLSTPTANITTPNELVPRPGVYAVRVMIGQALYDGAANIGNNPTFGNQQMSYEVHVFDFEGTLLDQHLRVYFIKRIRDEKTFSGVEELKAAIDRDLEKTRRVLSESTMPIEI